MAIKLTGEQAEDLIGYQLSHMKEVIKKLKLDEEGYFKATLDLSFEISRNGRLIVYLEDMQLDMTYAHGFQYVEDSAELGEVLEETEQFLGEDEKIKEADSYTRYQEYVRKREENGEI